MPAAAVAATATAAPAASTTFSSCPCRCHLRGTAKMESLHDNHSGYRGGCCCRFPRSADAIAAAVAAVSAPTVIRRSLRPAGRRRTDGLPDLMLLCSAKPCSPAGRRRKTDNKTCRCFALAGRRWMDGLPDLLLLCSAGPCGLAGRRWTDGIPDLRLLRSAGKCCPEWRR